VSGGGRSIPPPLVSILLPAWNAADTLPACLRSIQRQTERRWECVLVDDGSTDGTLACARQFAERDQRFLVLTIPHAGIVTALNTGLAHCGGTWVARMDADDVMHRYRLAAQRAALEGSHWIAAGTHVRLFPRARLTEGRAAYERWLNGIDSPERLRAEAFVECPIAHPALMIRRDVLAAFGYRDRGWPEDYDLILRLLASDLRIGVVPRRLLCWRDRPARLSRASATYATACFTACKAAFLAAGFLTGVDRYILWGYGETGRALRRALLAHGKRPAYIVEVHTGRLGNRIHEAPVVPPEDLRRLHGYPVVVSVAGTVARQQIRAAMRAMGFEETRDFVCAA
jgi:glycosyltransferase involved in cell wall biosynthesis